MGTTTYSQFRENLADVWNDIEDTQEPVIIKRRGHQDMAILPADELESLRETAYLLRSPKNARRLLEAIARAVQGEGEEFNRAALSAELGLDDQKR
jgi:antitoxin YefM